MLIDISYFFADIQIGQLSEQSVQDALNLFITQYEYEYLSRLLGFETYKELTENGEEQRWKDLTDGKEYTRDGVPIKWDGLANSSLKLSPIANYVYCQYVENELTATGGAGEGKVQMQNAIAVTSARKIRKAWNRMVDMNNSLYRFLDTNDSVYTEWNNWRNNIAFPIYLFKKQNEFGI